MNQRTTNELNKNQSVQSDAYAVMGVGQASFRAHSKPSKNENNGDQGDGQNLEIDVESESKSWVSVVKASNKDGRGDDKEEDYGSNDSMANDETVVLREFGKATGHACRRTKSQVYIKASQV
jgi:hypothetical protein